MGERLRLKSKFAKNLVREFWDRQPCDTWYGRPFPEGSLEFFETMEEGRYSDQAFIHSFVQFTRWHGKKVLEIGCGSGTDLLQFARGGARAYGVDISAHSLALTRQRLQLYGLHAEVLEGDAENLAFPPDTFDLVYSWGVLHHTPNPALAIREIHRVLKPGAVFKGMLYRRFSGMGIRLYLRHGLFAGKPFVSISQVLAERLESPGTKAYTVREAKRLFGLFADVKVAPILLPVETRRFQKMVRFSWLAALYPRVLASWMTVESRKST